MIQYISTKLNIVTQSVDDAVKAFCKVSSVKKGMGCESPAVKLSVCASKFLYLLAKAGHWVNREGWI